MYYLGIDVGTQGVRGIIADDKGNMICAKSSGFKTLNVLQNPDFKEQLPSVWWESVHNVCTYLTSEFRALGHDSSEILSMSLDATSGTILLLDKNNEPLTNGIMYNDSRSHAEAKYISKIAIEYEKKLGYKFNSSYALNKILWLKNNQADVFKKAKRVVHQADYIIGMLTGVYDTTDYSNALKTGYDIIDNCFPEYFNKLDIDKNMFPNVVAPGKVIGNISQRTAEALGLSTKIIVCAGATDGYASSLSAGAVQIGEWASVLGTTLVIKGVVKNLIADDKGRVYCHKHPQGFFMPGGASNVGGRCLNEVFAGKNFSEMDKDILSTAPSGGLVYPLCAKGERFPFVDNNAEKFEINMKNTEQGRYCAYLEGVAYVERLCYDVLRQLNAEVGEVIFTSGGGAKSDEWLKIRASVLNKTLKVPKYTDAALGCCAIAASNMGFENITQSVKSMVQIVKTIEPDNKLTAKYDEIYAEFKEKVYESFEV